MGAEKRQLSTNVTNLTASASTRESFCLFRHEITFCRFGRILKSEVKNDVVPLRAKFLNLNIVRVFFDYFQV